MSFDYDLFVIGGGSGGVRAARIAAGGRRVEARTPVAGLEPDVGAAMLEGDSPAGRLRFLAPALRLGGAPAGWDFAAVPAGTHAAAWRS